METFIKVVARDIIKRFGTDLRDVTIVFPNKRAGIFMNQQLAACSDRPVWAPNYRTISELFHSLSEYTLCDDITAVCELYKAYTANIENAETLDQFYGWGEVILSDFDDVDKHMVDAQKLFLNIRDIKEIEKSSFLTPEQEQTLKKFFSDFSIEENTKLKENFLRLWNKMGEIYTHFNKNLRNKGILYEGALYKDVVQKLPESFAKTSLHQQYLFVGFNVLNEVEKALFQFLKDKGKALFYWDYDNMYVKQNTHFEAGTFIRQNLIDFPNSLPEEHYNHFNQEKQIEFIATSSDNTQARYIPEWLQENMTTPEHETAIVLCNEQLLQPVLHSLPDDTTSRPVKEVNITMGFPLIDTPIYSFIHAAITLQTDGYDEERQCFRTSQIKTISNHPYFTRLDKNLLIQPHRSNIDLLTYLRTILEQLAATFTPDENTTGKVLQQLYNEALYRTHQIICRFLRMTEDGTLDIQINTLRRLLLNVLGSSTIPFHGEPAVGLQVMGVLETRNLDFKHILMLSVNEGMLPKQANDTSFIPYHLRESFGLTTAKHKIAVYAFYFYRLLQRAERITFMYNIATEGVSKNEISRFLLQLLAETDFNIKTTFLQSNQSTIAPEKITVEKSDEILKILINNYDSKREWSRALSPSAINTYIDCPLKFYFQQVAGIRIPKDPQEGMDAALFGTTFHEAAELIYKKLCERDNHILKSDLEELLENHEAALRPYIDNAFIKVFFDGKPEKAFYNGELLIARKVISSYLKQLLRYDATLENLCIESMEQEYYRVTPVNAGSRQVDIKLGGKIDRLDTVMMADDVTGTPIKTLRVVDYKTGGSPETKKIEMETLFKSHKQRPSYIFQTFLYSWVISEIMDMPVSPALFYVHRSNTEDYDPTVSFDGEKVKDFRKIKKDFKEGLDGALSEIFNPEIPFTQTTVSDKCSYCDYKCLCRK